MARKPRIEYPGAFFHILVRGNNRENLFQGTGDYLYYLNKLHTFFQEGEVTLYAYCLMPNHIHLLLEMGNLPLSKVLQRFHTSYTTYFNKKYDRVGHVFQGRYKAIVCDRDTYLLELVRYIHLNPVRAGLVERPEDYPWSSHTIYAGTDQSETIDPSFVLTQFSENPSTAKRMYRSFIMKGATQGKRKDLYRISDQRILGNERFHRQVVERFRGHAGGEVKEPTLHFELDELKEAIEQVVGTPSDSLRQGGRFNTWTRRIFCYIARTSGAHKGKDVARFIEKDLATVTQGVRIIENLIRAKDQKTIGTIKRILNRMRSRNTPWKERETILTSFFTERADQFTLAYLFGSLVKGKEGPLSDVDIAVCFKREKIPEERYDLAFQIKQLLGVDDVDLIVLNRAPIELKYRVIRDGRLIFFESVETKVEFEAEVLSQYGDYLPVLERQRGEILEGSYGAAGVQRYRKAFGQTERMLKQIGAIQKQVEE